MRANKPRKSKSLAVRLLNILIVVLSVVTVIALARMVVNLNRAFNRDPYGSIEYSLQSGDYDYVVRTYYSRNFDVEPFSGPYEESYYVAQYADAAFRYRFFSAVGDTERAGRMEARMEQARDGAGQLIVSTQDIDRLLEDVQICP